MEEGWWEGMAGGKSGVFPSNFVEMIEDTEGEQPATNTGSGKYMYNGNGWFIHDFSVSLFGAILALEPLQVYIVSDSSTDPIFFIPTLELV